MRGAGHQGGQACHQVQRLEEHRFGAVLPATFERVDELVAPKTLEPLGRERRPSHVTTQSEQRSPVCALDTVVREHPEAVHFDLRQKRQSANGSAQPRNLQRSTQRRKQKLLDPS